MGRTLPRTDIYTRRELAAIPQRKRYSRRVSLASSGVVVAFPIAWTRFGSQHCRDGTAATWCNNGRPWDYADAIETSVLHRWLCEVRDNDAAQRVA